MPSADPSKPVEGAANAPIQTGYVPGEFAGGAAGSNEAVAGTTRGMVENGYFATEMSPDAQVGSATNLSEYGFAQITVDPETGAHTRSGIQDFQTNMNARFEGMAEARETRKGLAANYGLVEKTNPETGEVSTDWADWDDASTGAGATDQATLANRENSSFENSTTAYTSGNVEDSMMAFADSSTGESAESEGDYFYGDTPDTEVSDDTELA